MQLFQAKPDPSAQQSQTSSDSLSPSAHSQLAVLSVLQMVMAIFCIIIGDIMPAFFYLYDDRFDYIGYGMWIGFIWLIAGIVGLRSAKDEKNERKIAAALVMNIISAAMIVIALLVMIATSMDLVSDEFCIAWFGLYHCYSYAVSFSVVAWEILMSILSVVQLAISIWCAVLCCGGVYCKDSSGQVLHRHKQP